MIKKKKQNKTNPPTSTGDEGDMGSVPELGRSSGVGNGNPLQYSCLENPMDRGAWQAIVQGVARNQTQLSPCISTSNVIIP